MTFKALAKDPHLNLQCNVNAIKNALYKRGYHRRLARHKPPISEKNRVLRLEFAYKHLHWSEKQCWEVL
jgi:Transposase